MLLSALASHLRIQLKELKAEGGVLLAALSDVTLSSQECLLRITSPLPPFWIFGRWKWNQKQNLWWNRRLRYIGLNLFITMMLAFQLQVGKKVDVWKLLRRFGEALM